MKAVNAGEVPGGVIYHYYWFGDQAEHQENSKNAKLHYFGKQDPGAFVSVSGGGVLASSKNQAAAQAFLAFITGKAGQDDPPAPALASSTPWPAASLPTRRCLPLDTLGGPDR